MNYYERHLGDYAKDTAHLSMLEHGAYNLLLDRYYSTETGIPASQAHRVARARSKEEKQAVDDVLSEFFTFDDGVWINQRAEEEIARAHVKIAAAKENGKKGGRPKKPALGFETETQEKPSGLFVGSETETQEKAHQTPDTSLRKPLSQRASCTQPESREQPEAISRKGIVCGLLRKAGMADSAPHYLTDETWGQILAKRTDEEIVEVARAKMAAKPNERIGLKYIAKALMEDPQPIIANARASPNGNRRQTTSDERKAASIFLTGRTPENERPNASTERDITGESTRVA
jgi:uncharacterized protein YdaU (DUF1376 family)